MRRQLIINADDFGLTPGVTEGILQGAMAGCITSTSVMINQFMHQHLAVDPGLHQNLGFGVHLNITTGQPVLPPEDLSTLVGADGAFQGAKYVYEHINELNLIQIEKEWRAQVIGFLIKFGRPDHIDSHHHVHLQPRLFQLFLQIAGEMRTPIRFPIAMDEIKGFPYTEELRGLTEQITPEVLDRNYHLLSQTDLRFPDYFCDDFITPNIHNPERLMEFIHHLPEGITEMMCHPGYLDDMLFQISTYTQIRVDELKALTAPQLGGLFEHENVELVKFSRV